MNTAEEITAAYFSLCRNCFIMADRKVAPQSGGNGRQMDLLAHDAAHQVTYHVETSVTHRPNFALRLEKLNEICSRKFFGSATRRSSPTGKTDHDRGKDYLNVVCNEYEKVGTSFDSVKRVFVCWFLNEIAHDNNKPIHVSVANPKTGRPVSIEVLSMRDYILPQLLKEVGTSNYENQTLRMIGLISQMNLQRNASA